MPNLLKWVLFVDILLFLMFRPISSSSKVWTNSLTLSSPDLWTGQRLPCHGQGIILPSEVVLVPSDFVLGPKVYLPENGFLLFPSSVGAITLVDRPSDCPKLPATLNPHKLDYRHWDDPNNWMKPVDPVPHAQRLPCRYDRVVLPRDVAPKVAISSRDVDIQSLDLGGQQVDTISFRELLISSTLARKMFQVNTSLTIHGDRCLNPEGCLCGNEPQLDRICSFVSCPGAACSDALKPSGHCCYDVCGAIIHIDSYGKDATVFMEMILELVQATIYLANADDYLEPDLQAVVGKAGKKPMVHDIGLHMSRVAERRYEIIIVNRNGDVATSIAIARNVFDRLEPMFSPGTVYLWMEESGIGPPSALKKAGKALGVLLLVVAASALLGYCLLLVCRKRKAAPCDLVERGLLRCRESVMSKIYAVPGQRIQDIQSTAKGFSRFENSMELSRPQLDATVAPDVDNSIDLVQQSNSKVTLRQLERHVAQHGDLGDPLCSTDICFSFSNPAYEDPDYSSSIRSDNLGRVRRNDEDDRVAVSNPLYDIMVDIGEQAAKSQEELDVGAAAVCEE